MGATKIITKTKLRLILCVCALVLMVGAVRNLAGLSDHIENQNEAIRQQMMAALRLPQAQQPNALDVLRVKQEAALVANPAEPYAWARLSYLKLATQQDRADAMAALHLSDMVSPDEPRQMLERAVMWHDLRDVQDEAEKMRQVELWQQAYHRQPQATLAVAKQKNLSAEVEAAIKR